MRGRTPSKKKKLNTKINFVFLVKREKGNNNDKYDKKENIKREILLRNQFRRD
jgi:hypothetical protein